MPIRVVCPNGHALRVKDNLAGKPGVCPTCQAGFVVPASVLAPGPTTPPAAAVVPAEAVEWRVALSDGQQFGPTVPTVFSQWIRAGRVTADALVWRTGWDEWRPAGQVAAELPVPLPSAPIGPAEPAVSELPAGVTLPPPAEAAPAPVRAASSEPPPATTASVYALRKKRQARGRRNLAILLAVACLGLVAMLVWLVMAGPPANAPVVPIE